MCQFYVSFEMEYLEVYTPNQREKDDPMLFAKNVRQVMANKLGRGFACLTDKSFFKLFQTISKAYRPVIGHVNLDSYLKYSINLKCQLNC